MNEQATKNDAVELTVPLQPEFAATVRMLVSSIGADLDFTVDELDDLRLGVSELFTLLADDVDDAERCVITIEVDDHEIAVTMSRDSSGEPVVLDGLASTILLSVVDSHEVTGQGVVIRKRALETRS